MLIRRRSFLNPSALQVTLVVLFLSAFGLNTATAQSGIGFSDESTVSVEGTSNQSDWTVTADSLDGWVQLSISEDKLVSVSELELTVLVSGMKSGKSPIMDRLMNRTLKTTEHKEIVYVLTQVAEGAVSEDGSFSLDTVGDLTIAGQTNRIQMTVDGSHSSTNQLVFSGAHEMKMTDFEMQPPTALFGALRTKDDIIVHFNMVVDVQD